MDKAVVNPQMMRMTGPMAQEIETRLRDAFNPATLEVINDSAMHSGHSGDDGSGESHFTIVIAAEAFRPMTRLARQRAVIAALGDIPGDRVHAMAIRASVPGD